MLNDEDLRERHGALLLLRPLVTYVLLILESIVKLLFLVGSGGCRVDPVEEREELEGLRVLEFDPDTELGFADRVCSDNFIEHLHRLLHLDLVVGGTRPDPEVSSKVGVRTVAED